MALMSDAVVGINGSHGSKEVMELAHVAEKPLLPLPSTGGAACELWQHYRESIVKRLNLQPADVETLEHPSSAAALVELCLTILKRVLRPTCFSRSLSDPLAAAARRYSKDTVEGSIRVVGVHRLSGLWFLAQEPHHSQHFRTI